MSANFFGVGFAFPVAVDPQSGGLMLVGEITVVEQALRVLLRTAPGERVMRPDYGCDLRRFLFAPNTVATRRLIAEEVARSIAKYEDRVDLTSVDVTADEIEPAQVNVIVRYTLRRTGASSVLVQPIRLDGET